MMNERGQRIKTALPSDPVQVLGFDQVPQSSDIFAVVDDEKEIKRITSERQRLKREIDQKKISAQSLDSMSALIKEGTIKNLPIIASDLDYVYDVCNPAFTFDPYSKIDIYETIKKAIN